MSAASSKSQSGRKHHNRWLVLIAAEKFFHALLFVAIGIGARRLLHKDIADEIVVLADHLRFDPESRFVNFILEKASLLNDPALRRIGFVAFAYAGISLAEGIGLYLERAWASSSLSPSPPRSCLLRLLRSPAVSPGSASACSPSTSSSSSTCSS